MQSVTLTVPSDVVKSVSKTSVFSLYRRETPVTVPLGAICQ